MQSETTSGFAGGVKAGNRLAVEVNDLALRIDFQAGERVMAYRSGPCGIERRLLNFELRSRSSEVRILSGIHKRIVFGDCGLERSRRNRLTLIRIFNFRCEIGER